ncbi:MAG: hypothetical protein QM496_21730 [Verrucomicrobiota bacterium]
MKIAFLTKYKLASVMGLLASLYLFMDAGHEYIMSEVSEGSSLFGSISGVRLTGGEVVFVQVAAAFIFAGLSIYIPWRLEQNSNKKIQEALEWAEKYYGEKVDREKGVAAKFIEILSEQVGASVAVCEPRTRFMEDLDMTDLEPVEVVMAVEEEFGLEPIKSEEAEEMFVIDDLIQYIVRHVECDRRATGEGKPK